MNKAELPDSTIKIQSIFKFEFKVKKGYIFGITIFHASFGTYRHQRIIWDLSYIQI